MAAKQLVMGLGVADDNADGDSQCCVYCDSVVVRSETGLVNTPISERGEGL